MKAGGEYGARERCDFGASCISVFNISNQCGGVVKDASIGFILGVSIGVTLGFASYLALWLGV